MALTDPNRYQTPGTVSPSGGFWSQIGTGATSILLGGLSRAVDAEVAERYMPKPDTQYQSVKPGTAAPAGVGVNTGTSVGGEWYKSPIFIGAAVLAVAGIVVIVATR